MRLFPRVHRIVLLAVAGCSPSGPDLHPVRGKVLFNGKPAEGATVIFQPASGVGPMPCAVAGPDGAFALATPEGPGAPPGDYKVVFTWFPAGATGYDAPPNKLPDHYGDPAKSTLTAAVAAGDNDLPPFELTKSKKR